MKRSRVQTELGQNLATRPELEDIEASARFFEDEDGLHIHSFFFFLKMPTITPATLPWRLPSAKAACSHCASANYPLSASTVCACVTRRWSTATPTNCCSTCSRPKSRQLADEIENIYSDLEKLSRVIMEGHQGDEYDEALVDAGGTGRYRLEGAPLSDGYPARAELPRAQGAPAGGPAGAGAGDLRDIGSLLPHNESLFPEGELPDCRRRWVLSISSRTASSRSSRWSRWYSCRQLWWPPATG